MIEETAQDAGRREIERARLKRKANRRQRESDRALRAVRVKAGAAPARRSQ